MENKKSFGEYIYKRRKESGLTQKEFAEKLFVTESAVSKWERGISYPDITLIRDICEILSVSEHELLTASEDVEARNSVKLAQKYVRMIIRYRNILSIIYGISLIACLICNLAIQHKLSWFFIVLTSEMIAMSLTLVPVMISERKALVTLGVFTISLSLLLMTCSLYTGGNWFFVAFISVLFGLTFIFLPFILHSIYLPQIINEKKTLIYFIVETLLLFLLLFTCNLYTGGGWFLKTALPITMFSLTLPWGMMLIIRYIKINKFFKAAGCLALASAFQYCLQWFLSLVLKDGLYGFGFQFNFTDWSEDTISGNINMIIFIVLLILTFLFTALGIYETARKGVRKYDTD
jgi:transcriptional regulator with XRE-family HTH domain